MKHALVSILAVVIVTASLSACGRRGPLEAPSAAANPSATDEKAPQVEDKPFILDGLIK